MKIPLPFEAAARPKVPQHVAIIMDGNGRWAKNRGLPRSVGHAQGTSRVKEIIREADRLGVKVLTLYCFSTENWARPVEEVGVLMELLEQYLLGERDEMHANQVKLSAFGQLDRLPARVRTIVEDTIQMTEANTGLKLNFCISYGSRTELVQAVQQLARQVADGTLEASSINEATISAALFTNGLPDPDLIIRTSGEYRLSNFLLWQAAYSELYVTDTLWPDFEASHFRAAIEAFGARKRRFGLSDEPTLRLERSL
jgi:undecaprenyl diphosphate synthase